MEAQGFVGLESVPNSMRALVRPGQWVVDVGANIGLVTGPLCRLVGPSGRVWAIEPIPRNVQRLEQLRDLNGLNALRIIPCALGSRPGTAGLRVPVGGESGWASFTASWISGASVQVRTERLDDLIFETPPDRPVSFIKIDVEGFEDEVLLGARRTLTEMGPAVLCEFNDVILRDAGSSAEALMARFDEIGYGPSPAFLSQARHLQGQVADILMVPASPCT
jgi:FkbM family methyltransferase